MRAKPRWWDQRRRAPEVAGCAAGMGAVVASDGAGPLVAAAVSSASDGRVCVGAARICFDASDGSAGRRKQTARPRCRGPRHGLTGGGMWAPCLVGYYSQPCCRRWALGP